MIRRYNRKQFLLVILSLATSALAYGCAWSFFRFAPGFAAGFYDIGWSSGLEMWIAAACLLIITVSGYSSWKSGGGLRGYHESALYHELDLVSGGTVMVDLYAHRITGSAHLLSQIFLAGPLCLLRAGTLWMGRIPNEPGLELRLGQTLSKLREINKWQAMTEHPQHSREILYLAQIGKIDFSAIKGVPRIKARPSDS